MAIVTTNVLVDGLSGRLGRSLVFRTYHGKTFVSATARKPDKKKETPAQRKTRVTFQEASEWASAMMLNPAKKTYYKQRAKALKLPNAYTAALTDYMRKPKVVKAQQREKITYHISKPGFAIQGVTVHPAETTGEHPQIISRKQNAWIIAYTPINGTPPSLNVTIIDDTPRRTNLTIS